MSVGGVTRVVVVGGGCSGTLLAAEIMSGVGERRVEVVVVDPDATPGRGVAYSTSCSSHLLNVPAEQMSAYAARPGHFAAWAHQHDPSLSNLSFAPRKLYGEYLAGVWRDAQQGAAPGSSLSHCRGRAVSAQRSADGMRICVGLADGERLEADHLVLAMGNLSPRAADAGSRGIDASSRYIADPWRPGALDDVTGSVLLIGTGLTAVDVALMLTDRGIVGPIRAVSRHGLLPRSHRPAAAPVPAMASAPAARTVRSLVAMVRRNAAQYGDWRRAVGELRPHVVELWRTASDAERRRFMRHASRFWEIHRHRMAPEVADRVGNLIATHRLTVRAGSIAGYRDRQDDVAVMVRRRGSAEIERFAVSHVINCTGPQLRLSDAGDPFVDSLLASGLVRPGPYGLGLDVADGGAIVDAAGVHARNLWAIGPMRRGVEWETTAAREIRCQAVALAARLSACAGAGTKTPAQDSDPDPDDGAQRITRSLAAVAVATAPTGVAPARIPG
jgi:uncharacterized NAD(P)/FAD-binding protein YdhS